MKIKARRYYIYYLARIAMFCVAILSVRVGLALAEFAGRLAYMFGGKSRKRTVENLKAVFPEKDPKEIEKIAKKVFVNLTKNAVEWINMHKLNKKNVDNWIEAQGLEKVDKAFSEGKGTIILASHFGNWELTGIYFRLKDYPGNTIGRRIYFNKYDELLNKMRRAKDVHVIYRDESPKKMLKVLKDNRILGIVADQDVDSVNGVFVDFMGRKAYTPTAPVGFALASGAPIIPCFVVREKGKHKFIVEDPVELVRTDDKEETIRLNTQKWSKVVEKYIRRYPEQWVWMHKRWKTQSAAV